MEEDTKSEKTHPRFGAKHLQHGSGELGRVDERCVRVVLFGRPLVVLVLSLRCHLSNVRDCERGCGGRSAGRARDARLVEVDEVEEREQGKERPL